MHTDIENYTDNQIKAALTADIQTAIALWEAQDWETYKTTRDVLLALIRSSSGEDVGIKQMQFIYFINTHLRHRFAMSMTDRGMFLAQLPSRRPAGDKAWKIATEGAFFREVL